MATIQERIQAGLKKDWSNWNKGNVSTGTATIQERIQRGLNLATAAEQTAVRNKNLAEAAQKMSEYQQMVNPTQIMTENEALRGVSSQRAAAASYPRLSVGERVGQTLAGLQEGRKAPAVLNSSKYEGNAGSPKQIIQNRINQLRRKGQQEDETGTPYYKTAEGQRELVAEQTELEKALSVLYGENLKIKSLEDAQKILDRLPEVSWGRWSEVDAYAGQAMQKAKNLKDAEERTAFNEYAELMKRPDFVQKSVYKSTATGEEYNPGMAMYGTSGFGDLMYDYINKNQTAIERRQLLDTTSGFSALGLDQSFLQTMSDGEVKIYNYLYATEGKERANEFLEYIHDSLTARQRQEMQQWFREYAQENPVKASVFSVLQAPTRGLSYLGQTADLLTDGKIDQNAAYNKFADVPNTIRAAVTENWGEEGSAAYNIGMSMADFLMTFAAGGGNKTISLGIMGSGAAANAVIDAKDRGLSDGRAYALGVIAGAAEIMTERFSIEALLNRSGMGKNAVTYVLKNMLAEAGEEASSSVVNLLADVILSQDESQWQKQIDQYYAMGMSREEAANLALRNQAMSIGIDALGGAISGGILSGGNVGAAAAANRVEQVNAQNEALMRGIREDYAALPKVEREHQLEDLLAPLRREQAEALRNRERQEQLDRLLDPLRTGKAYERTETPSATESPRHASGAALPPLTRGALEENRQDAANQQLVDISPAENQQGFEQAQNMPVQSNAQAVDVNQEVLNNEQGQVLSGNGPQRGSAPADAGSAGALGGNGKARAAGLRQSDISTARTNRAVNAGLTRVNSREIGLINGTDTRRNMVLDDESLWDDELRNIKQQLDDYNREAREKYGRKQDMKLSFVLGKMEVGTYNGESLLIDGVANENGEICIQVNQPQRSATELFDHEMYHVLASETPGLTRAVWGAVQSEGLNDALVEQYRRFYTEVAGYTDEMIREEILADAYAGLERVQGTNMRSVRDIVRELTSGAKEAIDQGWYDPYAEEVYESVDSEGRETRGPPETRYSVAEDFESKCEQIENGTLDRSENPFIYVSATTPGILIEKAGAQNLPIIISYESLYLAVRSEGNLTGHYHNLGADAAAKIVEGLADPSEIIELQNGRINAVVQFEDESGRTAMVSVELAAVKDFQGKNSAYNLILTMFEPRGRYLDNVRSREGNKVLYKKENQAETSQVNPRLNELSGTINEEPPGSGKSVPQGASVVKARFSLSDPVEQTETLIALHNMTEEKLRRTIELGAWPAPSIAIVQAEQGHTNFGDYSAVFPRSTIDPEADSRNRVYGSDAWTPTHSNALIESEVNFEARRVFDDMIYDLSRQFARGTFAHSSQLGGILSDESTTKTLDDVARSLAKNEAIQAAYLQERGETLEPVMKEKVFDSYGNAALSGYIESVGYQELARLDMELTLGNRLAEEDLERVKDAMIAAWTKTNEYRLNRKPELREKRIEAARNRLEDYRVERFIKNAWEYYENYGESSGEIDRSATAQKMFDMILPGGSWDEVEQVVQDWVRPKLEGVLGESGIYNGRDRIINNGRRSFKQTHYPVTAENIVRAMYEQGNERGEGLYGVNAEGLASVASPEYRSVDEMHADEGRLRTEDEEVHRALMQEINDDIQDFTERTMEETEAHASNSYEERNIIEYVLVQAAGQKTVKGVQRVFRKEGYNLPAELAQAALDLYNKAATAPTKYFEAKPERVVEFDEALTIVMPDSAPADLISKMQVRGVDVRTYETDNEQDRMRVLNEIQGARFSVAEETEPQRRDLTPGQELSRKEQSVIKRAINSSRMQLRDIVPAGTREAREVQQMQILDLAQKLWENGEIAQTDIDEAYEEIWRKGATVDRELADQYAKLRADLKAGVTVSEALKRDITDYEQFRRANIGTLIMRNGAESDIDVRYRDWARDYPNFFPESIMEPADQLERAVEVAQMLKPTIKTMGELARGNSDYDYMGLKADFTDLVRTMELEILHPVQEITKKQKDQKEAERAISFRQIYKEVMDEVFKVQQREAYEPEPEHWHEVADDARERMNERAEAIQTEWLRSLTKEGFKGTESLDELGVKIAGSVADYHLIGQILENHKAAQVVRRDIRKAERKLKATAKEKQYAAGIVSGTFSEADITGDARPHVVLELADYYMMERMVGLDLIDARRNDMYAEVDYQVETLMQDKDAYKVSSSPVLFYRTPQRNMIRMYGREQGQKIYDFLFAPVAENEAERIRWVNKMYDEVRLVEGENGKKKPLNRKERALVQMVMEGRAAAEVVAAMEERQVVYDAADNLRNGQAIEDVVREFNLNKELSEAATGYATWLDTNDILQTTKGVDLKRIENAVELYAKQYNRFYKAINDFLAAHGYEPIGFIKGYAPHIQPEGTRNLLQSTLKMMGLSEGVTTLPASIAGQTHTYRPNKRWNPYFMSRHGDATEYDVTAGYESYVDYLSDILYHTDDTVRIRRAANYFRRTYAPDEISNNLSWAEGLRNASPEQKAEMLREQGKLKYTDAPSAEVTNELFDEYVSELYDNIKDQGKYSNFVNWLEDYANQLTGKQSLADRGMEVLTGRQSLNFANKLNRAFQRANVAGNLSTALNQTAQLPMIVSDIGSVNTLLALKDYAKGVVVRDGFREKSDFLTARKGMNNLVVDPADRVINIMFTPAQVADDMISNIAARGAYIKAVRQGMSDAEAMKYADQKAEQIMGSRAKGSAPQAFRSKNPMVRMVNMFQIEALNAFEYVEQDVIIQGIKDIKQIDDSKGRAKATAALIGLLGKMLVAAFLWNRVTEELYGGSPAQFDLLGYAANFLASGNGLTANEQLLDWIDMAWERAFGEPLFAIDPEYNEEFDWANATSDLGYAISSDIPLVRNIAGLLGLGDQSLPMPDLSTVYDAGRSLMSNGASPETLDAALTAAGQFLPGGRQLNKTYQGARTMLRGGRYYGYGENERLQYPVEDTTSNWIKALLFGPSGLSENAAFYAAGGDDGLSAGNTRKYQEMMQVGMSSEMALEVYEEYRRINRLESMTASEKATEFANTLYEMGVPEDQAALAREAFMFWGMVPGEATRYDTFVEEGLDPETAYELTETLGELEPENGRTSVSNLQKYQAVLEMTDVESTRYAALAGLMQDKELARLRAANDYVQSGTYVEFLTAFDEAYPGETKSQDRVETVLRQMRLDAEERAALWQMCGPKWKTENNPFSKSVGREVAALIEEYYAEIDGE